MRVTKLLLGVAASAMVAVPLIASSASAQDRIYVPLMTYRTGAFAGSGIPIADGMRDYLTMLNERDGGIGGVRLEVEECETGYDAQKGVECYEATKGKGAVVYNPYSTGITLQIIPRAPVDKIPLLSMGYGLSAAAIGEKFPWVFNFPATYWSQASAIIKHIDGQGGIKGKKIGFIYLDAGYGREPIPLFEQLSREMGFDLLLIPVGGKEMQNQSSHWLQVRRERPDWMIMWGWGAMNPTAIKEAVKIRFPMERFIGVWWSGGNLDVEPAGAEAKGYLSANFHGTGAGYPAMQDIKKYVIDAGKSQARDASAMNENYYTRGVMNSVLVAEAIRTAQEVTGKKVITGEEMRVGLENLNLTPERLKEIGLEGFTYPIRVTCKEHDGGSNPIYLQQWTGTEWQRVAELTPMYDKVRPMLEAAAEEYIKDKPGWQTQTCN